MGTPLDSALEETIRTLDGTRGTWGGTDDINRLVHELATVVLRTRGQFDARLCLMSDRIESNHARLDRHGGRLDVLAGKIEDRKWLRRYDDVAQELAELKASVDSERTGRQVDIKADIQARAVLIRDRDEAVKRHADLLKEFDVVRKQRDDALACVEAAEMGMQEALASIHSWRLS